MKPKLTALFSTLAIALFLSMFVLADDDREWYRRHPDVEPVNHPEYESECGACHFAYQPGLLPGRSWNVLMAGLENHFGENAELDTATAGRIAAYLAGQAADRSGRRLSKRIMHSLPASRTPLRISRLPAITREHDELPPRLYSESPDVGSPGNCPACHRKAGTGHYDERTVIVPGYGRWDD